MLEQGAFSFVVYFLEIFADCDEHHGNRIEHVETVFAIEKIVNGFDTMRRVAGFYRALRQSA